MARIRKSPDPSGPSIALWHGLRPGMAHAAVALSQSVYQETTLSYREAEGARMRIAQLNGCLLCKKFRVADDLSDLVRRAGSSDTPNLADDRGAPPTEAFYSAVAQWRDSGEFSLRERLAIEYAERIALSPIELPHDDEFWARLQARFDDAEIVDLTYSITTWIATGRFVHVLGLDGACELDPARRPAQVA